MSRMMKRRKLLFGAATLALCGTLALGMTSEAPLILYPITPSLAPGLYVRTFESPKVGMIAAFRVPEAAKRYKASIGEDVHGDFLFMKPIVAGPGNHVCQRLNGIYVNGVLMASAASQNRANRVPPTWRSCRQMANDEFFAMSTYVPNSFDSRYFGPIRLSQMMVSYRSLFFDQARPRA